MYDIKIAMTATLGVSDITSIVQQAVETQTQRKVDKIVPVYNESQFVGFQLEFVPEVPVSYKSSKQFIETRWE